MTDERTWRIVIADDTPDIRELLRLILERRHGFAVVGEAADGREAVAQTASLEPDAILLDLAMPLMDGLQAIPELRRVSPRTKIVVLSGFEAAVMKDRALESGAHVYLTKGIGTGRIADALIDVCSGEGRHAGAC
jgi:DNA-binding NarL/FixJ family response regulator